jgi:hypothetical protein
MIRYPMFRAARNVTSKYDFFISEEELLWRLEQLSEIERAALEESTRKALDCHTRCYSTFCKSARIQAFPVTYTSLGLYLVQYCRWFGHTARSIPTIIAHIKRANRTYSKEWLDYESEWRLKDLIKGLKKSDITPSKQKLPITFNVMRDIEKVSDMNSNLAHFQHIVMSRVARDALLRGAELVQLRIGEITWNLDRTRATLYVFYSKAHKLVDKAEEVTIFDYGPSSGTAALRKYFQIMGMASKPPAFPLWPVIDNNQPQWNKALSKKSFVDLARDLLAKAGYPALRYAGHSYRSGGATDLWESQRCRPLTIKLHGRWRSDCYFLYIRDNPEKKAEEIAQALAFFEHACSPA